MHMTIAVANGNNKVKHKSNNHDTNNNITVIKTITAAITTNNIFSDNIYYAYSNDGGLETSDD